MRSMALRYSKSLWSYNPVPTGTGLYLPLWNPSLQGTTFKSVDLFGHICTRIGGVTGSDGITTDGDEKITIPVSTTFDVSVYSFACWVKPTTLTGDARTIVIKGVDAQADNFTWSLEITDVGKLRFAASDNATTSFDLVSTNADTITVNNWYFLAGVDDRTITTATTYIGTPTTAVAQDKQDTSIGGTQTDATHPIGLLYRRRDGATDDNFFIGTIGEVWYSVDKALTIGQLEGIRNRTQWRYL